MDPRPPSANPHGERMFVISLVVPTHPSGDGEQSHGAVPREQAFRCRRISCARVRRSGGVLDQHGPSCVELTESGDTSQNPVGQPAATPAEALELGVSSELSTDVLRRAATIAREIAEMPATSVGMAKRVVYQARELPMAAASAMEVDAAFRVKLDPESITRMPEYVALAEADRRNGLDQASPREPN